MGKSLNIPNGAFSDFQVLGDLRLEQLRRLIRLFSSPESATPLQFDFLRRVSEEVELSPSDTRSLVLVVDFLLDLVEESGFEPKELFADVRSFLEERAEGGTLKNFTGLEEHFVHLFSPQDGRKLAKKIAVLSKGPHDRATGFRSICDLRPVFNDEQSEIVGYVESLMLEVNLESSSESEKNVYFSVSSEKLTELKAVLEKAERKLEILRSECTKPILNRGDS